MWTLGFRTDDMVIHVPEDEGGEARAYLSADKILFSQFFLLTTVMTSIFIDA